jgi:SHS2 domain-containing protein
VPVYRWVDHTAELQLELEADSERGVFREALVALSALFSERTDQTCVEGGPVRRRLTVSAPDRDVLLAEWLGELAYLAEAEDFLPEAAEDLELTRDAVEATVRGRRASPPHLVKAVTYHRLGVWQEDGTWRARVILDV